MQPYFTSMAGARPTGWGPEVEAPALSANVTLPGVEVFVNLAELIDLEAEIAKKKQEIEKLDRLIAAKQKKLDNQEFLKRAPAAVVQQERDSLTELLEVQAANSAAVSTMAGELGRSQGGDGSAD
jgi:valyl-tRNA synthetase